MKLYLLRHAESESNKANSADSQSDVDLSEMGKEEAQNLISVLGSNNYDVFVVSPLKRTLQTIEPFLKTLTNPKVITNELTLERDLGVFTGTKMGVFQEHCRENSEDLVTCTPNEGESISDTYERAREFLDWLKINYKNKSVLVCGHKNFLRCLEVAIKDKDIMDFYSFESLKNGEIKGFSLNS